MSEPLLIRPPRGPLDEPLVLRAPPSKSVALRALVASAVAGGGQVGLPGALPGDVQVMLEALGRLGVRHERSGDQLHVLSGPDTRATGPVGVDAGDGGAPARFLLALAARLRRPVTVDGSPRLRERPMGPLLEVLAALGARVSGGPRLPVTITGPVLRGGRHAIDLSRSSQHASALLLALPGCGHEVVLEPAGEVASRPYLELTAAVLERFGLRPRTDLRSAADDRLRGVHLMVAGDWSAASVLLAAAAFLGCGVRVQGVGRASPQPDQAIMEVLTALGLSAMETAGAVEAWGGVHSGGTFDLRTFPDSAPALAALGFLAPSPVTITGVAHLRDKESDRIEALVDLLSRCGARASARPDGLRVAAPREPPGAAAEPVPVVTRGDHRIAMAAALVGLRRPLLIDDPECVAKSFPGFFEGWPGCH